jgi:transposase
LMVGGRTAGMYLLITPAKQDDVDPRAWLADVIAKIADYPIGRLDELLPWNWHQSSNETAIATCANRSASVAG